MTCRRSSFWQHSTCLPELWPCCLQLMDSDGDCAQTRECCSWGQPQPQWLPSPLRWDGPGFWYCSSDPVSWQELSDIAAPTLSVLIPADSVHYWPSSIKIKRSSSSIRCYWCNIQWISNTIQIHVPKYSNF